MTAVAKKIQFGKGTVYYVGTELLRAALQKFLLWQQTAQAIQPVIGEATALEITKRQADGEDLYFIINFKDRGDSASGSLRRKRRYPDRRESTGRRDAEEIRSADCQRSESII